MKFLAGVGVASLAVLGLAALMAWELDRALREFFDGI